MCVYLYSGPQDHVFVNFVDHGAPGLLAFPSDELYADDLVKALRKMAVNGQFAQVRKAGIIMPQFFSCYINTLELTVIFLSQSVRGGMGFCSLFISGNHDLLMCFCKALPYLFRNLAHILNIFRTAGC
jgi:hypothetical protein